MASKKTPEINGGSMADISFLMLIFFLMVSTMDPRREDQLQERRYGRRTSYSFGCTA